MVLLKLYGEEGVPFAALWKEAIKAIDHSASKQLPTLIFELEQVIYAAADSAWKDRFEFPAEDAAALVRLASDAEEQPIVCG